MQEKKEIDIRIWVQRILKNWYWFLLSAAVFGMLGTLKYLSTNNTFTVESEIMLRDKDGNAFIQTDMLDMLGMKGSKQVDDEIALLTSRDMIWQVVQDLNLQVEYRKKHHLRWKGQYPQSDIAVVCSPSYLDTLSMTTKIDIKVRKNDYVVKVKLGKRLSSKHIVTDLSKPITTCAGDLQFDVRNPEKVIAGAQYQVKIYSRLSAIAMYKSRVGVSAYRKDSKVISITSTTDVPQRAKDYIQKIIDLYNADAVADKNLIAQNTAAFIEERLRVMEMDLMQAEETTVQYLEKHGLVAPATERQLFLQEDVEYRKQLADVETQIKMMDYLCEFMEDKSNTDDLLPAMFMITTYQSKKEDAKSSSSGVSGLSLITAAEDYNALIMKKMRLGSTEGAQVDQIDAELVVLRANILSTVDNIRKALLISKQDLDKHFVVADEQRKNLPDHVRNYEKLVREKNLKEDLYLFMCEEYEENALLLASNVMPIKVITTPQINPRRVSPSYKTILVFLILGLLLPLGVIIIFDVLNNRVLTSKDWEARTKMPLLGNLAKDTSGASVVVREGANSTSAELFRTLRTNIGFMLPSKGQSSVLLVTSCVDNEGKSYVATNLAASMAMLGKKVALVGLDLRNPMIANYMHLSSEGCLTSYLSDDTYTLDDVVVPTSIQNLVALPAGVVPPNPSELLQSERLDLMFTELRQRYDYVIVDTASLGEVSDTFLLNRVADLTLIVARAKYTTYDSVHFLNQTFEQGRLPKMVAVLNSVNVNKK